MERETRVELATFSLEGWRSTNWATPAYKCCIFLVAEAGFEPTTFGLWARRATRLLYPALMWCLEPESNRHGENHHRILSPVRLPVPPPRLKRQEKLYTFFCRLSTLFCNKVLFYLKNYFLDRWKYCPHCYSITYIFFYLLYRIGKLQQIFTIFF